MKMLLVSMLTLSVSAFAQDHQCAKPGEVLRREFVKVRGDLVTSAFYRQGNDSIPTDGVMRGELKTKTFRVFEETFCQATQQAYIEETCTPVSIGEARGRGNANLKALYDLNVSMLKRAELFARTVRYFSEQVPAERLEFARQIVQILGKNAAVDGIPQSWESFSGVLLKAVAAGEIPQSVVNEITTLNAEKNKATLGFKPVADVKFTEGKGNGKLQRFFNLDLTLTSRSKLIRDTLEGVNDVTSQKLSMSFIQFASANGVPESWDQFVVMMKDAVTSKVISEEDMKMIVESNEELNRSRLGFDLTAKICKQENRIRVVNLLNKRASEDFLADVAKKFEITLTSGALLAGEKEDYKVYYDGTAKVGLNYTNTYNSYAVSTYTDKENIVKIAVVGTRNKITPPNMAAVQLVRNGKILNLRLQNKAFNPKIGGKVIVKVDFYEEIALWPDFKLGSRVMELTSGEWAAFNTNVQARRLNRKVRLDVSVQISGTAYYNESFSQVLEYKNL